MKWRALLISSFTLWACTPARPCSSNADCSEFGAICFEGLCVSGDGGAGGGGGGTTGGGGGATGGGGGTGGGSPDAGQCVRAPCNEAVTFCFDTATGFECRPRWTGIAFLAPDAGAMFNGSTVANVGVAARLVPSAQSDGGGVLPGNLSGSTNLMRQPGNTFTGSLTLPSGTGPRTIQAAVAFDAGVWSYSLDASVVVNVDTEAPVITVVVLDRDAGDPDPVVPGAWKKDEKALVSVTADGPGVSVATTDINPSWAGAVTETSASRCACAANCQCFEIDLAPTTINGLRGTAGLTVGPVQDVAGNSSNAPNATVNVTRFKWERVLATTTASGIHPTGVSADGVSVTPIDEGTSSRIFGLKQDGSAAWNPVSVGLVTSGPALGLTNFWVGYLNGTNVGLHPVSLATGTPGTPDCTAANSTRFLGDLALANLPGAPNVEGAIGVRERDPNGGDLRAADGNCTSLPLQTSPSTFVAPARVVVREGTGVDAFASGEGTLWKANLGTTNWTAGGAGTFTFAPAAGLFLSDGGSFLGGGGGSVGNGGVFSIAAGAVLDGGVMDASTYPPSTSAQAGPVSVGANFVVYGDSTGRLVKVDYAAGVFGSATIATNLSGASTRDVSPVLGAGSLVYVVSRSRELFVRNVNAVSTPVWSTPFISAATLFGQPALDVLRDSAGGKQCRGLGVLYLPTVSAGTATLTALLVDSEGLDKTAPWPKYQRDNANTGNASRSLDPWTCP